MLVVCGVVEALGGLEFVVTKGGRFPIEVGEIVDSAFFLTREFRGHPVQSFFFL